MIRSSLLLVGLVGGASATLTNTTRQTLLADRLTNQSLLGSGGQCSALGRHCNQNNNNCTSSETGSESCYWAENTDWLCGSEATCCIQDGANLGSKDLFHNGFKCDGVEHAGDSGTNDYCCSGQCCYLGAGPIVGPDANKLGYRCGTDCRSIKL